MCTVQTDGTFLMINMGRRGIEAIHSVPQQHVYTRLVVNYDINSNTKELYTGYLSGCRGYRNIFLVFNRHVHIIRRAFLEWDMTYLHEAQGSGGGNAVVTFRCCNIDNRSLMLVLNQGASSLTVTFLVPLADLDLTSRRCCSSSLS